MRSKRPTKGNNGTRKNDKQKRVMEAYNAILNDKGETPTITHLANVTGVSRKTVSKYLRQ